MSNSVVAPLEDLLQEVFELTSTLIVFKARKYTATAYFPNAAPRSQTATRPSLEEALLAILGREPTKHCPVCRQDKLYGQFSLDISRKDKRTPLCRHCHSRKRRRAAA